MLTLILWGTGHLPQQIANHAQYHEHSPRDTAMSHPFYVLYSDAIGRVEKPLACLQYAPSN
eukprot:6457040-Amphidinium_carterae.1